MPPLRKAPTISAAEADLAFAAAQCVVETHRRLVGFLRVGQTLPQIDAEVARILAALNCRSCFHLYKIPGKPAFPSHACLSVNECVVHGTAGSYDKPLREGDILKIDIGVAHPASGDRRWIGDAGWTYAFKSYPSDEARRLLKAGKESLRLGVQTLRPDNKFIAWAHAVQKCVETDHGFHLVRGLGGHGIGRYVSERERGLHLPPFVSNIPVSALEWPEANTFFRPGTLVAVEPMLAVGTGETREHPKLKWPIYSADGSMTAHYEHDVLITESGPRVLTEGMDELPDLVG